MKNFFNINLKRTKLALWLLHPCSFFVYLWLRGCELTDLNYAGHHLHNLKRTWIWQMLFWQCDWNTLLKEIKLIHIEPCNFILVLPVCPGLKHLFTSFLFVQGLPYPHTRERVNSRSMGDETEMFFSHVNKSKSCSINHRKPFHITVRISVGFLIPSSFKPYI